MIPPALGELVPTALEMIPAALEMIPAALEMIPASLKMISTTAIGICVQVIAAEGEHKASRALRHAADVIAESPAALQVTEHVFLGPL